MPLPTWKLTDHIAFDQSRDPEIDLTSALNTARDFASCTHIASHQEFAKAFLREFIGLLLQKAVVLAQKPDRAISRSVRAVIRHVRPSRDGMRTTGGAESE